MHDSGASRRGDVNACLVLFLLFEKCEVGVCASLIRLASLHKTHPSCPDLIRASINLRNNFLRRRWIPGSSPVSRSLSSSTHSRLLLPQLFLMRLDEFVHAAKLKVDVRKFSRMHGGTESFLCVSSVDPA